MKAVGRYFLLASVFIASFLLAVYFEFDFRVLVLRCCLLLTNHDIHFVGKNFLFFPTGDFQLYFSIFSTLIAFGLIKSKGQKWLLKIGMILILLFLTLVSSCWIYAAGKVAECTACQNGQRTIRYNEVPYNIIFLVSLLVPLMAFIIFDILTRRKVVPERIERPHDQH